MFKDIQSSHSKTLHSIPQPFCPHLGSAALNDISQGLATMAHDLRRATVGIAGPLSKSWKKISMTIIWRKYEKMPRHKLYTIWNLCFFHALLSRATNFTQQVPNNFLSWCWSDSSLDIDRSKEFRGNEHPKGFVGLAEAAALLLFAFM